MRLDRLAAREPGEERGAVSYDALIAGIAHARGARWLLTANARDFAACLKVLSSNVEVVRTDDMPVKGQLSLVHQAPQSVGPAASAQPAAGTAVDPPARKDS